MLCVKKCNEINKNSSFIFRKATILYVFILPIPYEHTKYVLSNIIYYMHY